MRSGGDAGFTLLEVLAAVAIAGFLLSAIGTVVAVTTAGMRSAPDRAALTEAGQTLLASLPSGEALRAGTTSGTLGVMRWRVDVSPLPDVVALSGGPESTAPDGSPAGWRPAAIAIAATAPSGRRLRLDTVGLIRRSPP